MALLHCDTTYIAAKSVWIMASRSPVWTTCGLPLPIEYEESSRPTSGTSTTQLLRPPPGRLRLPILMILDKTGPYPAKTNGVEVAIELRRVKSGLVLVLGVAGTTSWCFLLGHSLLFAVVLIFDEDKIKTMTLERLAVG